MNDILDLTKNENENKKQYQWRLCSAKNSGVLDVTWDELAKILNTNLREDGTELTQASYRKPYETAKAWYEDVFSKMIDNQYSSDLVEQRQELEKEKVKFRDERNELNRVLREQARKESMVEVVKRAVDNYSFRKFDYSPSVIQDSDNDLIIHLTDLHEGMNIESVFNTFNTNILEQRLNKFLDEINEVKNTYKSQNVFLILGGDLIHGLIHVNSRIESKEDVVEQIMNVSDLVGKFIKALSKIFQNVEVHTTAGNHARSMANKDEAIKKENFDLLVPYICKKDLKDVLNVRIVDNMLDCDIATFSVRGHMVYATHGDKDNAKSVVNNMTKFARKAKIPLPDMCYLGHRHTNGLTTVDDVKVIESGCLDGMDSYAIDKRLVGTPEQTITVVTENRCIKALCDVQLD